MYLLYLRNIWKEMPKQDRTKTLERGRSAVRTVKTKFPKVNIDFDNLTDLDIELYVVNHIATVFEAQPDTASYLESLGSKQKQIDYLCQNRHLLPPLVVVDLDSGDALGIDQGSSIYRTSDVIDYFVPRKKRESNRLELKVSSFVPLSGDDSDVNISHEEVG